MTPIGPVQVDETVTSGRNRIVRIANGDHQPVIAAGATITFPWRSLGGPTLGYQWLIENVATGYGGFSFAGFADPNDFAVRLILAITSTSDPASIESSDIAFMDAAFGGSLFSFPSPILVGENDQVLAQVTFTNNTANPQNFTDNYRMQAVEQTNP